MHADDGTSVLRVSLSLPFHMSSVSGRQRQVRADYDHVKANRRLVILAMSHMVPTSCTRRVIPRSRLN
jgi:hypothetical protein